MTRAQINSIKQRISNVLQRNLGISPSQAITILPIKALQGKLYEASVLADLCENLVVQEGLTLRLVNTNNIMLKQKGGPINIRFPHIDVFSGTTLLGEIWTDIEFTTLSHSINGMRNLSRQDYHELDIAFLNHNCTGRPSFQDVKIAIECKNTNIKKSTIRELLGFRRELCFLSPPNATIFRNFPTATVPANPPSVHMLYCKDNNVLHYQTNCATFGILLNHYRM